MPERPVVSFRLRADITDGLKKLAAKDRRSLSQYVELVLEDHLKSCRDDKASGTKKASR